MPPAADRVTRIAHVGIAVRNMEELFPLYRDVLGLPEVSLDDTDGASIAGFAAGDALIELLESTELDSPIGKFVAKRGAGLHHICFVVDDLPEALRRCRDAGVRLIDETPRIGAEGKRIAFLHPGSTGGVLIELTEDE